MLQKRKVTSAHERTIFLPSTIFPENLNIYYGSLVYHNKAVEYMPRVILMHRMHITRVIKERMKRNLSLTKYVRQSPTRSPHRAVCTWTNVSATVGIREPFRATFAFFRTTTEELTRWPCFDFRQENRKKSLGARSRLQHTFHVLSGTTTLAT